jgi:hypothetical protein
MMGPRTPLGLATLVAVVALGGAGCDKDPCAGVDELTPGLGAPIADGAVCIGIERETLVALAGDPDLSLDLGAAGQRLVFGAYGLTVDLDAADATVVGIHLGEGTSLTTVEGVGLGSDGATVTSTFGTAAVDPFTNAWWYPSDGIGFDLTDGSVSAVHLFAPAS